MTYRIESNGSARLTCNGCGAIGEFPDANAIVADEPLLVWWIMKRGERCRRCFTQPSPPQPERSVGPTRRDLGPAYAAAQEGMERTAAANADWLGEAVEAVRQVCVARLYWTSDDVWLLTDLRPSPSRSGANRALGPAIVKAKTVGYCQKVDPPEFRASVRRHTAPLPVWMSLIFPREDA